MLSDLIFALNTVLPLFLVLLAGYILKKIGFLADGFVPTGNKLVFYVALPCSIFLSVYNTEIGELLDWGFALYATGISVLAFLGIWLVASFFIKDKPMLSAFAQGAFRGNFAFLGMPLLISLAGEAGQIRAALIMAFVLPVYNICTVVLLAACANTDKKITPLTILLPLAKNPIIIAVFLAVGFRLIGLSLPISIARTVGYGGNMATGLALICLGAGMRYDGFDAKFKYAFIASLVKVIALPVIFGLGGYMLGFRGYDIAALVILGGIPSAIAGYAMAVEMGADGYVAGTIVALSTLFSAFTLTIFVYLLRMFGFVG